MRTMLELGSKQDEVAVVDDQRGSPTFVGHLAEATKEVLELPYGTYHVAAAGDCTWAEFAEAIFEEAGLSCRGPPDHDRGARSPGSASRELGPAQRAGCTRAPALARGPASLPRAAR